MTIMTNHFYVFRIMNSMFRCILHYFDLLWICWTTSRTTTCTMSRRCLWFLTCICCVTWSEFAVDFRYFANLFYSFLSCNKFTTNRRRWSLGLTAQSVTRPDRRNLVYSPRDRWHNNWALIRMSGHPSVCNFLPVIYTKSAIGLYHF